MPKGIVKWFNNSKGYGFIVADGDTRDIFVHYTAIKADGFRTLFRGQGVLFRLVDGPKGLHALDVELIDDDPFRNLLNDQNQTRVEITESELEQID